MARVIGLSAGPLRSQPVVSLQTILQAILDAWRIAKPHHSHVGRKVLAISPVHAKVAFSLFK